MWEWLSQTLPLYATHGELISRHALDPAQWDELHHATLAQLVGYRDPDGRYTVPTAGWLLTATA